MSEPPHPPAVTGTRGAHERENAQENEPHGLIEVRLEGEVKARTLVVPNAVIVAGDHTKRVGPGRQARIVGSAAIAGLNPMLVEPLEAVAEARTLRCKQTQSRVVEFPLLTARAHLYTLRQR